MGLKEDAFMSQEELNKILRDHALWLETRFTKRVLGRQAQFKSHNFSGMSFMAKDISLAEFENCEFSYSNFRKLNAINCKFENCKFNYCDFNSAILIGSNFKYSDLDGSNFDHADLKWVNLQNANLRGVNLTCVNLHGANLHGANMMIERASPDVIDALVASFAAEMALLKTRLRRV